MFGTPMNIYVSDRPLAQAAALLEALGSGRSPEQLRALGETLDPWQMVMDAIPYREHATGPVRLSHSTLTLACAAVRAGMADLLAGMASRPEFHQNPPWMELRDANLQHAHSTLPHSCMLEAAARGRVDILDILLASCASRAPGSPDDSLGLTPRLDLSILSLPQESCAQLISYVCNARGTSRGQRLASFRWGMARAEPSARAAMPGAFLRKACDSGRPEAIEAALEAGGLPSPQEVVNAARHGAFELAARMAPTASDDHIPRGWDHHLRPKDVRQTICSAMAGSHLRALDDIAEGALSWRDPDDLGRELTWADFSDQGQLILQGQLMALRGAFDMPAKPEFPTGDTPEQLARGKAELACAARAMALLHPDPDASLRAIESACAEAGVERLRVGDELIFLARMGRPELPAALAEASPEAAVAFCAALAARHKAESQSLEGPRRRAGRFPEAYEAWTRRVAFLEDALFESIELGSRLPPQGLAMLLQEADRAGLRTEFERRALERSSSPAQAKTRGPLKV